MQDAEKEGGKLLTGGKRPPGLDRGYYVQPTVFTGMTPSMRLWREEVFGPVLAAMTFKTEEEAIQLANNNEFGLAGAVISADEQVGWLAYHSGINVCGEINRFKDGAAAELSSESNEMLAAKGLGQC